MSARHEMEKLLREALRSGRWFVLRQSKHIVLRHASGAIVVLSRSPSDVHAAHNAARDMRRAERQ